MKTFLLHFLILIFSLVLLTGCKIDGEEEITINSDGSGDIRVHFILPYKAFSRKDAVEVNSLLGEIAARHRGISIIENNSCAHGNYCQALKLHIRFDSAFDLERIVLSEQAYFDDQDDSSEANEESLEMICALLGNIDAGINVGGIDYHRELDLSPLFKGKIKNGAILGDAEFRYILNTPMAPDSHNADTFDSSSSSLVWTIPLKTYFNNPFTLQASYAGSEFCFIWAISLLLGIAVLAWFYVRFRRRGKTHR
ncbi:hypothetical protein [Rubritalea profundi]|uniref:DUF3153 domain-containing protein n=1 Tax=Rubritalea profundi TaxID=1658618 RepID=A0A2S7U6N9_9BACT|nr:hypothetical protein [Rubritalea profundi]PQJ29883.1 hypothetical protein BSZ32_16260 [Rubritalea profundi]